MKTAPLFIIGLGRELRSDRRLSDHAREIRARASIERRDVTEAEKTAGYIAALEGEIPFNADSVILSKRGRARPFVEQIAPDAFKRSITEDKDIMAFAGHTEDTLNAFAKIGENLTITTDGKAMRYRALVPDTRAGSDLIKLVDKKIITGTSFEFEVRDQAGEKWEKRDDRIDQRTILDARLLAVNPVAWPAYTDSSLTVELRRRGVEGESEDRGSYYRPDGIVDYWDPTVTPDTKFAGNALNRATYALTDALEYLRAAPAGLLADYAKAEVAAAAANAKTLIDWLAANGTAVNPAIAARAAEKLAEARQQLPAATPISDSPRETGLRIFTRNAPTKTT